MIRATAACVILIVLARPASAYIGGPPASLGMMCYWSTHVMSVQVEKIDKAKNLIVFRKIRDLKGKWPRDTVNQVIGINAPEKQIIMEWAEVGKITVICALESYKWSHTYIDRLWYAAPTADWQWWNVSHVEPILLRTYAGRPERLISAMGDILANREIVVPCMVDNQAELAKRTAKIQRVRSSLKLLDYNPKRDFVAWGSDELARMSGLPGFSHFAPLARLGADAQAVSVSDFNNDGKPDLLLAGANRLALMRNEGDAFTDVPLAATAGARSAVWADYNSDGKPDLFLATADGPKLFTNLGDTFRDDTALLPVEATYNLTAAAWLDHDGDGKPDLLLGNGFHGLRLYRNKGKAEAAGPPQPGKPPVLRWFEDVSAKAGLGEKGIGSTVKGDTLTVADVNGDGRPDFLYGAGTGVLVLNTDKGFVEAKDHGISYKPGRVGPVFADFDNDGSLDLFLPQNGVCKLFKGDGKGHFSDVTEKAGDLAKAISQATCAAWGDFDNDGKLDLVIGCLKRCNRFFRNKGNGVFEDATDAVGLGQRIFNTQAICLVDLNGDGILDMVFNNEGQESCVLLGNPEWGQKMTPLVVLVKGKEGVLGSKVRVLDKEGKLQGSHTVSGGDGRGGQAAPTARFALKPGTYKVEVQFSTGIRRSREITVASAMARGVIDETTPQAQ